MTPEEIDLPPVSEQVRRMIQAAVLAEREACAKVVEGIRPPIGMHGYNDAAIKHIAAAIRARKG